MQQTLIIIVSFLVFLFPLYILSKDDYALSKKNVSAEKVFDLALIFALLTLLFARLFYVLFNFSSNFFNPLYFFLIPYFPGLSFSGGILGSLLVLLLYSKTPKIPVLRIFDFFAISILCVFPIAFFIQNAYILTAEKTNIILFVLELLIYIILAVVFVRIFQKIKMEEGSMGFLILASLSFVMLVTKIFEKWGHFPIYTLSDLTTFALFLISIILYSKKENVVSKLKTIDGIGFIKRIARRKSA
ncbi:MAG: prolipoprotein diacylglyceryl transferase [bacterium]|nr:prolipoprotein diacylglyceryl transferase [bacterium]